MTDPFRDGDYRDEFEWEKEIRKDDDRVHDYLAELPRYIDLPDEDKVISKRIRRRGSTWDDDFDAPDDGYDDDYDDDVPEEDFTRHRDGSDVYTAASKMAIDLTKRFLADLNELIGEYEKFPEDIRDFFLKDAFKMRDDVLEKIRKYRRELKRR